MNQSAADLLRSFVRASAPGGCHLLSTDCRCPLCLIDELVAVPRWSEAAMLHGPFTPDGNGGNDGIVRDRYGQIVADCRGFEARADVIAELLNRTFPGEPND
jgi:hypothetical protein